MTENINFDYIFRYLENESVSFDKEEFSFQIKSHPSYPSLLSISDTLTFFDINNGAIRVEALDIELLPDNFVALLKEANNEPQLYFIKKKDGKYVILKDKIIYEIDYSSLELRWLNLVLLIEKSEFENSIYPINNKLSWLLPIFCLILFLLILYQSTNDITKLLFLIFPSLGILFSIAALKDLFGAKSTLINSFCEITTSTNCFSVVNSDKWKILSILNFSDLSIVFFTSQFIGLFILLLAGDSIEFFSIQKLILFASTPIILLSLYYQKFVEKKWCPICLAILSIFLLEIIYLFILTGIGFKVSLYSFILFGFVFISTVIVWGQFKKTLTEQKTLKEFQLKANRFLRNYEVFKTSLLASHKVEMPTNFIEIGNIESNTQIVIITNPFCGHCKEVHEIIDKILNKYEEKVQVKIIFKSSFELENDNIKTFFRILMSLYLEKGGKFFRDALLQFFQSGDVNKWINLYQIPIDEAKVDNLYEAMNNWCLENEVNYTPVIFINGYIYPNGYERENLEFFINDLIEDNNF